jgi:hypothetical protein
MGDDPRFVSKEKLAYLKLSEAVGGIRTSLRGKIAVITTYEPHKKYDALGNIVGDGFRVRRFSTTLLGRKFDYQNQETIKKKRNEIAEADVWFSLALEEMIKRSLYEIPVDDLYDGVHSTLLKTIGFPGKFSHRVLIEGALAETYDQYAAVIPVEPKKSKASSVEPESSTARAKKNTSRQPKL